MTSIIGKRRSLHKHIADQHRQNNTLEFQLGQLQALANIGITTCMIAHEINNLLTPLSSYADLALKNPDDKALIEKALQKTSKNSRRASKITESILAVANGKMNKKQNVALSTLVEEIFSCLCRDFSRDQITVNIEIPDDLIVWAIPIEIQQVLMNLILNARDAMLTGGGVLTIKACETEDVVEIKVSDSGCGIEPANVEKIFEPFFTTKAEGKSPSQNSGSGLGLAFCKKVIDMHEGSVTVETQPAEGTTFNITLPKPK